MKSSNNTCWHAASGDEALATLETIHDVLASQETEARVDRYGHNKFKLASSVSWTKPLLDEFRSPFVLILVMLGGAALGVMNAIIVRKVLIRRIGSISSACHRIYP
jgi:magnesium-transporting ATPase (P-type)